MNVRWAAAAVCLVSASAFAQATVTQADSANALSTVSQRHMVRMAPSGAKPTLLLAVERDSYGSPNGLHWYRSTDEGKTWSYYKPIFDDSQNGTPLHMTTDVLPVGNDLAVVISYDTTQTGFPSDSNDWRRKVYFQWWHYDGAGGWTAGTRKTIASPPSGGAYHRALVARDSNGRLWVQAWQREYCSSSAGANCADNLRVWVSTDGGSTFASEPKLARLSILGGGRLIHLGSKLMMLWGDYSWDNPAKYMLHDDGAAPDDWQGPYTAFSDGDSIYHGAALNAVADGKGGMHLVYKDRHENLYYRYYDGSKFGTRKWVDGASTSDWVLQPAITLRAGELFICTNHPTEPNKKHAMRVYRLSQGFGTWDTVDGSYSFKGYPTAPEKLPSGSSQVPCAYSTGTWPATVKVALTPVTPDSEPAPEPPPPEPTPEPSTGNPALSTLTDGFSSASLDSAKWYVQTATSGSKAATGDGALSLALEPNNGDSGAHVTSRQAYALTGSKVTIHAEKVTAWDARAATQFVLVPELDNWNTQAGFWFEQGTLYLFYMVNGAQTELKALPYSATSHAYWRLRESSGVLHFETSPDGSAWTDQAQVSTSKLGMDPAAVHLRFDAEEWGAGSAAPGTPRYSGLNR